MAQGECWHSALAALHCSKPASSSAHRCCTACLPAPRSAIAACHLSSLPQGLTCPSLAVACAACSRQNITNLRLACLPLQEACLSSRCWDPFKEECSTLYFILIRDRLKAAWVLNQEVGGV